MDQTRLAVALTGSAYTTLWRDYGSVVHRVQPELTYLLIPRVWTGGDDVFDADDEIDQLGTASQIRARLLTDWITPAGQRIAGFMAQFGRDFRVFGEDEEGLGNSEILLRADAPLLPDDLPLMIRARAQVAIAPDPVELTELSAGIALTSQYVRVGVDYSQLSETMPLFPFVAPEELVPSGTIDTSPYIPLADYRATPLDERLPIKPWSDYRGLTGSVSLRPLDPLTLSFAIGLTFDDPDSLEAIYGSRSIIRNTASAIRWDSPCDCWSAEVVVTTARDRTGFPGVQFALDLSRLGGI